MVDKFALALLVAGTGVQKGKAPYQITASVNAATEEIPASWSANRTRPLAPWPKYTK